MFSMSVSTWFLRAKVTVSRTELGVSLSAPSTNMPWLRTP
jgi:hypothetical protein